MTDTAVSTLPIAGQTWRRKGYTFRNLVVESREIEGRPYVLHRLECDEPGVLIRCAPVDEFVNEYEDPEWPVSPPVVKVEYVAVVATAGYPIEMQPFESIAAALSKAVEIHGLGGVVGVQRVTTVQTYEWVEYSEPAVDEPVALADRALGANA